MRTTFAVCAFAAALAACGAADSASAPPVGTLALTLARSDLVPAQTTTVAVTLNGAPADAAGASLTSSNAAVATVNSAGVVTAVAIGSTTIRASRDGASASAVLRVLDGGMASAAGGTIRMVGGQVELVFPAGAVDAATPVMIAAGSSPGVDPTGVAGSVYQVAADPPAFRLPVTLRVRYNAQNAPYGLPQRDLGLRVVTPAGVWSDVRPSTVDSSASTVTAPIIQAGTYGVGRLKPATPCTSAADRAFDFWVGDWNVTSGAQSAGQNTITIEPGGCAIFEEYVTPTTISPGRSISFYESATGRWYQTYVDAGANRLVIGSISIAPGVLVLTSPNVGNVYQRWSWIRQSDGTVRQIGELTTNNGGSFAQIYDLLYRKR